MPVIQEMRDISGRLDVMITYTIVKFMYAIGVQYLANSEVVLFAVVASIVTSTALAALTLSSATHTVCVLVLKLALMLVSQGVVSMMGIDSTVLFNRGAPPQIVLQAMTSVTCILLMAGAVPDYFRESEVVQRCVVLLLYMYADAVESLFAVIDDGVIATLACLLVYVCMHKYDTRLRRHHSLAYLVRALNMVAINFLLRSLSTVSRQEGGLVVQTVLYLVVLFIFDMLCHLSATSMFAETRDYAIWKTAQQMFLVYRSYNLDLMLSVSAGIAMIGSRALWGRNTQLVFQLLALVVVSVVLDAASGMMRFSTSIDNVVLLFVYVLVIHRVATMLQGV